MLRRLRLQLLVNAEVWHDGRLLGRVDALVAGLLVGDEVDSLRHHGSSADLEATLRRHERFAAAGVRLLHVTPWAVRRTPEEVVARVLAAVRAPGQVPRDVQVRPGPWETEPVINGT